MRWQVLQKYYGCPVGQAQAIADGGQEPLYGPNTLVGRLQELKRARADAKQAVDEPSQQSLKSDLVQRMELSAALVEAGVRG